MTHYGINAEPIKIVASPRTFRQQVNAWLRARKNWLRWKARVLLGARFR